MEKFAFIGAILEKFEKAVFSIRARMDSPFVVITQQFVCFSVKCRGCSKIGQAADVVLFGQLVDGA